MTDHTTPRLYGYAMVFAEPEKLLRAARRVRDAGYSRVEAYTPFPVEELPEVIGHRPTRIPLIMLLSGAAGGALGYGMQWYAAVIAYPINVAGRDPHSWPSFIPITFELTVLCAALAGVGAFILLNRFPQPYHPIFEAKDFERASQDRFFLCIEAEDPAFDAVKTPRFLEELGALEVTEVTAE